MKIHFFHAADETSGLFLLLTDQEEIGNLPARISEKLLLNCGIAVFSNSGIELEDFLKTLKELPSQFSNIYIAGSAHLSLQVFESIADGIPSHAFLINPEFTEKMHAYFPKVEIPVTVIYSGLDHGIRLNAQKIHDFTPMSDMVKVSCDSNRMINFMCEPMITAIRKRLDEYNS